MYAVSDIVEQRNVCYQCQRMLAIIARNKVPFLSSQYVVGFIRMKKKSIFLPVWRRRSCDDRIIKACHFKKKCPHYKDRPMANLYCRIPISLAQWHNKLSDESHYSSKNYLLMNEQVWEIVVGKNIFSARYQRMVFALSSVVWSAPKVRESITQRSQFILNGLASTSDWNCSRKIATFHVIFHKSQNVREQSRNQRNYVRFMWPIVIKQY